MLLSGNHPLDDSQDSVHYLSLDSIHYLIEGRAEGDTQVGAAIMLGTLFGLIAVVYGLVLRFDPEARR